MDKLYAEKRRVYIHCKDQKAAEELDDLLWTFKEESFIPHCLLGTFPWDESPIQIGWEMNKDGEFNRRSSEISEPQDVVIFLTEDATPPNFYTQFNRIVEIVSREDDIKAALRARYQIYKAHGVNIHTHTLKF